MKFILQTLDKPRHVVEFSKFVVYFDLKDDPDIYEFLHDSYAVQVGKMDVDEILTFLVNFAHTLSPNTQSAFKVANQEFG